MYLEKTPHQLGNNSLRQWIYFHFDCTDESVANEQIETAIAIVNELDGNRPVDVWEAVLTAMRRMPWPVDPERHDCKFSRNDVDRYFFSNESAIAAFLAGKNNNEVIQAAINSIANSIPS